MRQIALICALTSASAIGIAATAAELQRGRLMRAPDHGDGPAWFYGPNGQSGVFENADDRPKGWEDHPSKVKGSEPAGGGATTARAPANGSTTAAEAAKSTTAKSQTATDPKIAAAAGVGGDGATPTGQAPAEPVKGEELDAHGHSYDPALHAATKSKTKDGLWRMKVGVSRPAPAPGYPLDL